ncbi:hypothetical protein [Siccibacter turicensis]|uniref:hypothetical protein n=1 Tax=Siccibacter turicensis TaxID=357233 RepID=UPI0023F24230|nr:hypothetical protein [Siccibacter turicensis]
MTLKMIKSALLWLTLISAAQASDNTIIDRIRNDNATEWVVEKNNDSYLLKYINEKGIAYDNKDLIPLDVSESSLFIDYHKGNGVSIVIAYPRDTYEFILLSKDKPYLSSACKEISLTSPNEEQAIENLTLCDKTVKEMDYKFSEINNQTLLKPENLFLEGKAKGVITNDKAFLLDKTGKFKNRKPYLIKGDLVEIEEYNHPFIKINYLSKGKTSSAWVLLQDVM